MLCCYEQTSFTKSQEKKPKWETHSLLHPEVRKKKILEIKAVQNDKQLWKALSLHLKHLLGDGWTFFDPETNERQLP